MAFGRVERGIGEEPGQFVRDLEERAYQTVALIVGHIWRQACWQCLLEDWHVTLSCCIVHSSRKSNDFRGLGGWLDRLVTHGFN